MIQAAVFGTVFMDVKGFAKNQYNPFGRNLGDIQFIHGGIGRNVAENLGRLGIRPQFISSVDKTPSGEDILGRLRQAGVDTSAILRAEKYGMGMWLAVLDQEGELAGSISQMPDLSHMAKQLAEKGREIIASATHIILELDLTESIATDVLQLARHFQKKVYGIPGNLEVILKKPALLGELECFICNHIEAEQIIGNTFSYSKINDAIESLKAFVDSSDLRMMVVTMGEGGSIFYDSKKEESGFQPVFPTTLVDSSGAGDSFFSGTIMGLLNGQSLKQSVVYGTRVASWTIQSEDNVCSDLAGKWKAEGAPFV